VRRPKWPRAFSEWMRVKHEGPAALTLAGPDERDRSRFEDQPPRSVADFVDSVTGLYSPALTPLSTRIALTASVIDLVLLGAFFTVMTFDM
jgi:hypothetical protein